MEKFYCVELVQNLGGADGAFIGLYCLENSEIVEGRRYDCYYEFKTIYTELDVERKIVLSINKKFNSKKFPRLHLTIYQKARGRWQYYGYFYFYWNEIQRLQQLLRDGV